MLAGVQGDGDIIYSISAMTGAKYCGKHGTDGTLSCACCHELRPWSEQWVQCETAGKPDLCLSCSKTAIGNTAECKNLYKEVRIRKPSLGQCSSIGVIGGAGASMA